MRGDSIIPFECRRCTTYRDKRPTAFAYSEDLPILPSARFPIPSSTHRPSHPMSFINQPWQGNPHAPHKDQRTTIALISGIRPQTMMRYDYFWCQHHSVSTFSEGSPISIFIIRGLSQYSLTSTHRCPYHMKHAPQDNLYLTRSFDTH